MTVPEWESTACILCECNCGIEVQVEDRRLVRIRGDKSHPSSEPPVHHASRRQCSGAGGHRRDLVGRVRSRGRSTARGDYVLARMELSYRWRRSAMTTPV